MQSKEKIEQELNKHIEHRKKIYNDSNKKNDKKIHDIIIETLKWVLKDGEENV